MYFYQSIKLMNESVSGGLSKLSTHFRVISTFDFIVSIYIAVQQE